MKAWASSARKSYHILRDLVTDRRKNRDSEYVKAFEWLVEEIERSTARDNR